MPTKRKKRATSVKGTSGCSTPQSLSSTVTVQSNTLSNTLKASPPFKLRLSSGSLKKPRHCDPVSDGDDNESDINITDDTSGGGGGGSGGGGGGGDGGGVAIAKVEEEEDDTHRILMEKILTLQTDNESLTELNSIIKNELKKQGELVESLKKSSTKTQPTGTTTNTTAANEVIALHEQLQALRDQTRIDQTRLENEKTTLKAEIANLTADKDDKNIIEKALLALQEEKNSFKNKLQTTQQQLTDCKVAREKDNDSVEKLRKHQLMVDLKSSNENLRLKLEAANKTIEELRQEKETREKQDDHTTQVCTSSSDSPSPVEVSNTKGDEAVALELKKGDLHVAVNNLQSQAATAKQTKSGLEDEVAMLADKKLSLETALGHLRETKELSEREIKRLKQQQDKLSEQHVSMLLEVEKLGESRKELSRNIKNARAAPNFQQNQHQHQHQQQQQQQQHKQKGYKAGARNAANRSSTIPVPHPVPTREERSIFVIRHGERADETKGWKDASRPYDTPITPYGMKEVCILNYFVEHVLVNPSSHYLFIRRNCVNYDGEKKKKKITLNSLK